MFEKRSEELELMDDLLLSNEALRQNLDELEVINQRLGGYAVVTDALSTLLPQLQDLNREITIADLGCGGGDTLREIAKWSREKSIQTALIGIDANKFILEYAKQKCTTYPEISFLQQNIFAESFKQQRYDIIVCSLFCHHFSDEELVHFFRQFLKQARVAVIINDLHRHPLAYYSIKTLANIFSDSYLVKNDAPLSVLRAFKKNELETLAKAAGAKNYRLHWKWAFRWQLILYAG